MRTPRPVRRLVLLAAAGAVALASLALPALAQDSADDTRPGPGPFANESVAERHQEMAERLADALDLDADEVAAALQDIHSERFQERAAMRAERQERREQAGEGIGAGPGPGQGAPGGGARHAHRAAGDCPLES